MVTKKYSLPAKALIHVYMYFGIKKKIKEKSPFLLHINNNYSLQNKNWETAKAGSGENYTIRCIYQKIQETENSQFLTQKMKKYFINKSKKRKQNKLLKIKGEMNEETKISEHLKPTFFAMIN